MGPQHREGHGGPPCGLLCAPLGPLDRGLTTGSRASCCAAHSCSSGPRGRQRGDMHLLGARDTPAGPPRWPPACPWNPGRGDPSQMPPPEERSYGSQASAASMTRGEGHRLDPGCPRSAVPWRRRLWTLPGPGREISLRRGRGWGIPVAVVPESRSLLPEKGTRCSRNIPEYSCLVLSLSLLNIPRARPSPGSPSSVWGGSREHLEVGTDPSTHPQTAGASASGASRREVSSPSADSPGSGAPAAVGGDTPRGSRPTRARATSGL